VTTNTVESGVKCGKQWASDPDITCSRNIGHSGNHYRVMPKASITGTDMRFSWPEWECALSSSEPPTESREILCAHCDDPVLQHKSDDIWIENGIVQCKRCPEPPTESREGEGRR
jgi:hypothetical protein